MIKQTIQKRLHAASHGFAMLVAVAGLCFASALLSAPSTATAATLEPVEATIPVEIKLAGDAATSAHDVTVTCKPAAGETVAPASDTLTFHGAGKASFSLSYDEVGKHSYTVTQSAGAADGWTYDTRVYDVTVYCMWNERTGKLYTQTVIATDKGKDESCLFTNTYKAPAKATKPAKKPASSMPKTGDTAFMTIAALVAAAAIFIAGGLVLARRDK